MFLGKSGGLGAARFGGRFFYRSGSNGAFLWGATAPKIAPAKRVRMGPMPPPRKADRPTREQKALLRLISEQEAIQVDHLARFFDVYLSDMTRFVVELESNGWAVVQQLVSGESPWVGLCNKGAVLSGTGFQVTQPSITSLLHHRAMNEARLLITQRSPEGVWSSERILRREWHKRKRKGYLPDAAFELKGKRWAIEVELSQKEPDLLRRVIADHSLRYDLVVYLCSSLVARYMDRLNLVDEFSNLTVRDLFDPLRRLNRPEFQPRSRSSRRQRVKRREPEVWEIPILDLFAEQGAIPLDQLARFLECEQPAANRIALHLEAAGFLRRAHPLANQLDWFWLSGPGSVTSTLGLPVYFPKVGALERCRALNEVRLLFAKRLPTARWESGRVLRKRMGPKGSLPWAVVIVGKGNTAERHAIEVCLTPGSLAALEKRMARYGAKYHAAAFFCTPRMYRTASNSVARHKWPGVIVQKIPGYEGSPHYLSARTVKNRWDPVDLRTMVGRLRSAVNSGDLRPSRARTLAGHLLLDLPQVSKSTLDDLDRDCRKYELLRDPTSPSHPPRKPRFSTKNVEKAAECAEAEVKAGRLLPSRARTLVGYALFRSARVSQGHKRTVCELKRQLANLLEQDALGPEEALRPALPLEEPGLLTAEEFRLAHMAARGMTNCLIAAELDVSMASVSSTLGGVYVKLGITGSPYERRKKLPKALAYFDNGPVESQT